MRKIVDLCLLGCGGGMPMTFRNLSSLLINYQGRKILIDCGEGTQVALREIKSGFKSIDIICITHCHGDHIVGLPGLLSTIGNSGREEKLIIIGPKGIKEVIKGLSVIFPYLPYELEIIENERELNYKVNKDKIFKNESNSKSDFIIKTLEVDHSSPCIAFSFIFNRAAKFNIDKATNLNVPKMLWNRLQKGEEVIIDNQKYTPDMVLGDQRKGIKLSFVTDTRPILEITEFVKESDLLITEATYGDDLDIEKAIKNKHMTFREAADLAKESNSKQLLLTHFSPAMENPIDFIFNAKDVFESTIIGEDYLKKTLKFEE